MNSIGPRNDTLEESVGSSNINSSCLNLTGVRGGGGTGAGKKRDSSCKISNETVAGIEILFKEKDFKYLEFLFVYYMDDPIRKDRDWELFDRLSLRKRRNGINLNSGPLFES
ncbi:Protein Ycf2 [Castilleja foliolosa]|uniref:Protein Ycf2 n=1 Tax=Castilleja foliolosa TaxID=1961234 RepID=A0ABD3B760_9LAMI